MMEGLQKEIAASGKEILVVEDSPTQAAYLCSILEDHGYSVSVVGNGREALAALAEKKPDLVISDVIMPEMNGYELCRAIKADPRSREIPVILLTSLAEPQDVVRGLECGADNFISKPYSEEHLLSRISHMRIDQDHPQCGQMPAELEIFFAGQKYAITAGRRQILNLLLSTYEAAVQKNQELIRARDELNELNARLAATNEELEAFSYTVSHDLRGPLTGITGFSEVLLAQCGNSPDGEGSNYLRYILRAARRMEQLIETLLEFSRLTSAEPDRKTVDLSRLARTVADELKEKEPERRVQFTIAEGVTVNGDARLLRVVLENLIGNAWKYSGKREETKIEFGVMAGTGTQVYFVRDNGAGFDRASADKLFAPFQRLHDQEEFEGHGIGLATVHRIIQRHGGRIWAEGEPDRGATFYFTRS
jgi:two-component system sensor histidine kinase/response regulator